MRDSFLNTITVPQLGLSPQSANAMLAIAGNAPLRVVVRNIGAVVLFLAHNSSELPASGAASQGGTYQLPTGQADIFVLAPGQGLYAAGNAGAGLASIAGSEAIPIKTLMES